MEGDKKFDVIIVGGGPAGIITAIIAARKGHNVLVLDASAKIGRKILVCGSGRCNLTNAYLDLSRYHGSSHSFVGSVLGKFDNKDIIKFFNELGVEVYEEKKGKIFPITNQSKTIRRVLLLELERLGVVVEKGSKVLEITKQEDRFSIITTDVIYKASKVVISTGGKTYPAFGSDGSGYDLAKKLGHDIVQPVPVAVPLTSSDPLNHKLQGQKWEMGVSVEINNKHIMEVRGDVIFTSYGLSGSAILDSSREISIQINRYRNKKCWITLDTIPDFSSEQLQELIAEEILKFPERIVRDLLIGHIPTKFIPAFADICGIEKDRKITTLSGEERRNLASIIKGYRMKISGTRGWNEAEFTAGGVNTKEVDRRTLESRVTPGLYFAGEVLNVDGDIGGFNLTWAWSSGFTVGGSL